MFEWSPTNNIALRCNWRGHFVVWIEELRVVHMPTDYEYHNARWVTQRRWRRADRADGQTIVRAFCRSSVTADE